jgi:hypothetical protein
VALEWSECGSLRSSMLAEIGTPNRVMDGAQVHLPRFQLQAQGTRGVPGTMGDAGGGAGAGKAVKNRERAPLPERLCA